MNLQKLVLDFFGHNHQILEIEDSKEAENSIEKYITNRSVVKDIVV